MTVRLDLGDIQGLFARGYRGHPYARFTIFTIPGPASGGGFLTWLLPQAGRGERNLEGRVP